MFTSWFLNVLKLLPLYPIVSLSTIVLVYRVMSGQCTKQLQIILAWKHCVEMIKWINVNVALLLLHTETKWIKCIFFLKCQADSWVGVHRFPHHMIILIAAFCNACKKSRDDDVRACFYSVFYFLIWAPPSII